MKDNYSDIQKRIPETPKWYDQNGCPRYDDFHPSLCPNIYANRVVLLEIACQACERMFLVEMHADPWLERPFVPLKLHYGDPPNHGCVGDTMNCDDLRVVEAWERRGMGEWHRMQEHEGKIE